MTKGECWDEINSKQEKTLMIQRKNSTLDIYEYAGAILRLLKALGTKAAVKVSSILNAADMDKLAHT